jgi:hypothetical protein
VNSGYGQLFTKFKRKTNFAYCPLTGNVNPAAFPTWSFLGTTFGGFRADVTGWGDSTSKVSVLNAILVLISNANLGIITLIQFFTISQKISTTLSKSSYTFQTFFGNIDIDAMRNAIGFVMLKKFN